MIVPPRWVDPARVPRRPVAHLVAETLTEVERIMRDLAERSVPLLN
ncbi:MAG: hypothetical protein ACFCVF_07985 [Kineosporiaceae bacterium]